jgi:RIO-like serine/threonine protein kinase
VNIQRATAGGGERHVLVLHQHHKQTLFGRAPRPRCASSEERTLTVLYIAAIESEKKKMRTTALFGFRVPEPNATMRIAVFYNYYVVKTFPSFLRENSTFNMWVRAQPIFPRH